MQRAVPWEGMTSTSMPWFLERCTLHDSGLRRVSIDWDGVAVIEIDLDVHWNPFVPQSHTALWIRFEHPYRITHTQGGWRQATLQGAESAALDREQREAVRASGSFVRDGYQHSGTEFGFAFPPDDDTLTRTLFDLVNWGKLEILHAGPVRCALADGAESVVDVTTLDMKPRRRP